jgi:hypothetical protein
MKLLKNNRLYLLFTGILLINCLLYFFQIYHEGQSKDINLILRRIDTPYKVWLNGYIGFLFNVKYVGLLNWLLIPLGIYYFRKNTERLSPQLKAILLALSLITLLIAVKGFFNVRYQLSLYPVSIILFLFLLSDFIRDNFKDKVYSIFFFISFLIVLNNMMYLSLLQEKPLVKRMSNEKKGFLSEMRQKIYNFQNLPDTIKNFNQSNNQLSKALFFLNYLDTCGRKNEKPYVVLDFIDKLKNESKILVNNFPMLYYYTGKRGVYYWSGDDTYFGKNGVRPLLNGRTDEQITKFVKDSLQCRYVLSSHAYNLYNERFHKWIGKYGKPICFDASDFILYEIQDSAGNYPLEPYYQKIDEYRRKSAHGLFVNDSLRLITD